MFGKPCKFWNQVALATFGGLIIIGAMAFCIYAFGGTADPVERMEARATERAAPTATPEVVCPTPEEQAYFDKVAETAGVIERASLEHAELLGMAANNPAVTMDPEWRLDALDTLRPMRPAIEEFRTVAVPESVQYIHVEFMQALGMTVSCLPKQPSKFGRGVCCRNRQS